MVKDVITSLGWGERNGFTDLEFFHTDATFFIVIFLIAVPRFSID